MLNLEKALELTIASRENIAKSWELEELIKQELREELAWSKGGNSEKKRFKAVEKYLKNYKKKNEHNTKLHGAWEQDGKQYFTNTISGFELTNKIEGLTESEGMPSLKDIIKSGKKDLNIEIEMPDIAELKIQLKEAKVEEKIANQNKKKSDKVISNKRYFKMGESWFDIKLLLEILDIITGDIKFYGGETEFNYLVMTNEEDTAILLPVRMKKSHDQKTA